MTTEPFEGQLTVTERLSLAVATVERLRKSVEERDRRIAELAQSLIDAAGKIDAAEARVAALDATAFCAVRAGAEAIRAVLADQWIRGGWADTQAGWAEVGEKAAVIVREAGLREITASGGTSALDAVVSAAVAAERARIRARVEALAVQVSSFGPLVERQNVISAIDATEGGAP